MHSSRKNWLVLLSVAVPTASFSILFLHQFEIPGHIIGGLIYVLMLLMVITSFDRPARALGALNWRRLHKTGLYALGVAFVSTLLPETPAELLASERWWFVALSAAAVFIRLTAFLMTRKKS